MGDGIYLTLMIGPGIPIPVPQDVIEALVSVQVQVPERGPSGFELTFAVAKNSPLLALFLLTGGAVPVPFRVVLVVTMNGAPEVIADGIMTDHQIAPGSNGTSAMLTIRGTDLTALMNLIPFDGFPYPALPPEARALLILAKYAVLGIIPLVIPTLVPDIDIPLERIPRHKGTDLEYLKTLADDAGYVFHIEPGPVPLTNTAYWGPEIKVGVPQPALTVDLDSETNVEGMNFTFRNDQQVLPIVMVQNQLTKIPIPIPIPDVSLINPPLGVLSPFPRRFEILDDTARLSIPQAILRGLAAGSRSADCLTGSGTLSVTRYGQVLKARRLVGVRGAGDPFDGLHYVTSVTHSIKRGEYKQSFQLSRNGLLSITPRVPV
ncbi:MAG TPA: hypothetical protein VH092_20365 [Urbifossiella sp.]|jgi:hypothetical protein|nr:hypothetical protein [Urbifossiella sp.]